MEPALGIDLIVKSMVVTISVYPIVRPESGHFAGRAMGVRAVAYPAAMLLIPATWLVAGQPGPYPFLSDIALGLPFLVDAAANVFGLFDIKGFDAIPHSTGWFWLSIAFGLAVAPLVTDRWVEYSGPTDRVGATLVQSSRMMGFEDKTTWTVVAVEPMRLLHLRMAPDPGDMFFRMEPEGGATRLAFETDYEMPKHMPGFLKDLMSKSFIERQMRHQMENLKAFAEATVPVRA